MPTFVFTYRKGTGYIRTAQSRAAWADRLNSMSGQLADTGQPVVAHTVLGNCSPDSTEPGGYTLVRADDLEAATALAKGCPHLEHGGGVEVGELGEVPGDVRPAG